MASEGKDCGKPWEARLQWLNVCVGRCATLKRVSDRLGCSPWALACAGCMWILGFVFWGFTGELVCLVTGFLYPMWASFRALEDHDQDPDGREPHEWLAYWVTFSMMTMLECVFYRFLTLVPFYHPTRLAFTVWLFHPSTRGSSSIYRLVVGPMLRMHRDTVDAALSKSSAQLHESLCGDLREELRDTLRSAAASGAEYVRDLGIDDLVAQQLAKGLGGSKEAADQGKPTFSSSRARAATPPPRASPVGGA